MIRRILTCLVLILTAIIIPVSPLFAADISNFEDRLSRSLPGIVADHTIRATVPTSINASNHYLRLDFPLGFDFTGLTASDASLTFGPTRGDENTATLGGSLSTASQWGFTISSSLSGTSVVFSAPLNPSFGISANWKVIIKFGLNAGGTHQIMSPGRGGVYGIRISTASEEKNANILIDLDSQDSSSVTVTVPGSTGGGEAPIAVGPTGGAITPPLPPPPTLTILNLHVEDILSDRATVVWETSADADRQVEYGQTTAYGGLQSVSSPLARTHRMTILSLASDQIYYVRVSSQASGVSGSGTTSFRTSLSARTPVISDVRVVSITDVGATVLFTTNIDTVGSVSLGSPPGAPRVSTEPSTRRSHELVLMGLAPGTEYAGSAGATAADGVRATPVSFTFRTLADRTPPPNPSSLTAIGIDHGVRLDWVNPSFETGDYVLLRASLTGAPLSPTEGRLVYSGREAAAVDAGLLPDTLYYYTLFAIDAVGNPSSGITVSARTRREATPAPEPTPIPTPTTEPATTPVPSPTPSPSPAATTPPIVFPVTGPTPLPPSGGPITGGVTIPAGTEPGVAPEPTRPVASSTEPVIPLVPSSTIPELPVTVLAPLSSTTEEDGLITDLLPEGTETHIYVAGGALELLPFRGIRTTLPSRPMTFRITMVGTTESPTSGQLRVGDSTYLLTGRSGDGSWETTVIAPAEIRDTPYEVILQYADRHRRHETGVIRTRPFGVVRENALVGRTRAPAVSGASILITRTDGSIWDGTPFQEVNPMVTGENGLFGFVLPQGRYHVKVNKEGFRAFEADVDVQDQVLAIPVTLTKQLFPVKQLLSGSLGDNAQAVLEQASIAAQIVREVTETPEVQEATKVVAAPTAAVATVAVTATAVSSFSAVNYARFLFTQPLLLIRRRRRNKWGVVYNSLSKQPIELAIVRLVQAISGVVVQTRITDAQGRFSFLVPPGQYKVQVIKPSYVYPTTYLKAEKEDGDFLDLYHGERIDSKEGALLTPNIPIDPVVKEETPAHIVWRKRWRQIQSGVGLLGTAISIGAFFIAPSWLTGGLFALQIGSYALFRRLALPPKPKGWGITYDAVSKQPVERAIVRVFDKKFNKLLETQITDQKGKYAFFAGKGQYYVTAEKAGYDKFVSQDIDLRQAKETIIDRQLALTKQQKPS